jgi:hypothetical protein
VFQANGIDVEQVDGFCYLGRELVSDGTDAPAIAKNIRKARARWGQISRLLVREGADSKIAGNFYKVVVQSVLLYGSETWVVSQSIMRSLTGFHNQVARRISGCPIHLNQQTQDWIYPSAEAALATSGLLPVESYIKKRHSNFLRSVQYDPMYLLTRNLEGGAGGSGGHYWGSQDFHQHLA